MVAMVMCCYILKDHLKSAPNQWVTQFQQDQWVRLLPVLCGAHWGALLSLGTVQHTHMTGRLPGWWFFSTWAYLLSGLCFLTAWWLRLTTKKQKLETAQRHTVTLSLCSVVQKVTEPRLKAKWCGLHFLKGGVSNNSRPHVLKSRVMWFELPFLLTLVEMNNFLQIWSSLALYRLFIFFAYIFLFV